MENSVQFKVFGRHALFTDPLTKIGGEKCSYQIPTYEALKGILSSVYWKPTIIWVIDKVRVMKPIRTETRSMKPIAYSGGNSLATYTYLADVEYQVQAHFVWNMHRQDLAGDRNENKHFFVARRVVERGGRRDVFLGTRECQGYVEPVTFGSDPGYYDTYGAISFGMMFHGFDYPDEWGEQQLRARFWRPTLEDGVLKFPPPEKCLIRKVVGHMKSNPPPSGGLSEDYLLEGWEESEAVR
jgi:CRISPR-associated protein Cas5d